VAEKCRIVDETLGTGVSVALIEQRRVVNANQVFHCYRWYRNGAAEKNAAGLSALDVQKWSTMRVYVGRGLLGHISAVDWQLIAQSRAVTRIAPLLSVNEVGKAIAGVNPGGTGLAQGIHLMGIRSTGIAIGILLALSCVQQTKADEFHFTFTPNQSECAKGWTTPCTDSGSGVITVAPPQSGMIYNGAMPITGMTGTVDGSPMSFVSQGYPATNGVVFAPGPWYYPAVFLAGGQEWGFIHYDTYPDWYSFLYNYNLGTTEPINLTITAPEPSTLMFLGIGLLGLVGLTLLKNRVS
jgi:hypothetical protein